jgi:hypothetical protein
MVAPGTKLESLPDAKSGAFGFDWVLVRVSAL